VQVTEHVHDLPVRLSWFPQPYPPNVFVIVGAGGEAVLVDAGFSDDESFAARRDALAALGPLRVRYLVLTHHHYDHSSGARRLQELTGAEVVMHRLEAPLLRRAASEDVPSDLEVPPEQREARERMRAFREEAARVEPSVLAEDGQRLEAGGLSVRLIHTPGHTAGHLCVLLENEGVLFAGDNVLGLGTTVVPPPPHGDMAQYVASLHKLQEVNARLLLPGHGPPVKEPYRKLQELIDHRRQREEQVLALVREGRDTVKRLVRAIYPELDRRLLGMAESQVRSHLAKLEAEGRVVLHTEGEGAETRVELL
jgi:glyoxylase-like metal-dependent hydrolase (beta-lactamase superfamily II)